VLNNCCILHAEENHQLVEDEAHTCIVLLCKSYNSPLTECRLIFFPPYSPYYNLIEQAFSSVKAILQRNWQNKSLGVIDHACHNITLAKAVGYFKALEYIV
jgi:transposase